MAPDDDLDALIGLERSLLDPAVRADPQRVGALLHPDFVEFGASGTVWTRERTVEHLAADPSVSAGTAERFEAHRLGPDVVLLTFRIEGERPSLRSSVWVRDGETHEDGHEGGHPDGGTGWRMRFHQGTLTAD